MAESPRGYSLYGVSAWCSSHVVAGGFCVQIDRWRKTKGWEGIKCLCCVTHLLDCLSIVTTNTQWVELYSIRVMEQHWLVREQIVGFKKTHNLLKFEKIGGKLFTQGELHGTNRNQFDKVDYVLKMVQVLRWWIPLHEWAIFFTDYIQFVEWIIWIQNWLIGRANCRVKKNMIY